MILRPRRPAAAPHRPPDARARAGSSAITARRASGVIDAQAAISSIER